MRVCGVRVCGVVVCRVRVCWIWGCASPENPPPSPNKESKQEGK